MKSHLDPTSCLATIDMGKKVGGGCAPFPGELYLRLTQCRLVWRGCRGGGVHVKI